MRFARLLLALVAASACAATARADVTPYPIFSDNMVLQRGVPLVIWGKAAPGEQVQVSLNRAVAGEASASGASTAADREGNWSLKLGEQKAGAEYTLTFKGQNTIVMKNVAVGEVWICSGQSNMEMSVNGSETPAQIKENSANPELRLYTVQKRAAVVPIANQSDLKHFTKWVVCGPESVGGFSAVAYHFGRKLQKTLGVPVGLIHTSWGGTPAEAWTSQEALEAEPSLKYYANSANAARKNYDEAITRWEAEADKAKAEGKPVPKQPSPPSVGPNVPGVLYNAMIYPLLKFKVKGAIWYQGESNTGKAYEYRTLFQTMIQDWRKRFDCELPFMLVQLAPFGNGNAAGVTYAELRDAQLLATKKLPKVGMAVITDVGNETDIHPKPKGPVGERLALAALALAYGHKEEFSGPVLKDVAYNKSTATLTFDHTTGGLVAKGGELTGFSVLGDDGKFYPAKAEIKGDTVVLSCNDVSKIEGVRYGWMNFAKPTLNLFNGAGLPASPFRTDELPLTTQPKK